jgi:proline iminopeptidase
VKAQINGIEQFFDVEGAGWWPQGDVLVEKPACFVLHGGPALDHSYFKPWLSPLADDLQLIYIDHRGTGRSSEADPESYRLDTIADDLDALRRYLGFEKVDVMGNSYGGFITLNYAVKYPDSIGRLFLIGTSASHRFTDAAVSNLEVRGSEAQKDAIARALDGSVTTQEAYAEMWQTIMPLYFHEFDDARREEIVSRVKGNAATSSTMFQIDMPFYDVEAQLGSIEAPTLITVGRHDWVTPPGESEVLAEGIPNSELIIYEESGHFPFIEQNQKFIDDVRTFSRRHLQASGEDLAAA